VPVALVMGMAGTVGALVVLVPRIWGLPEPPADITDARACAGSNVQLAEAAEHFAVKLPDDAAALRFTSGFNPFFGEYNFTVLFRTTPEGLRTLIADSGFAQLKAVGPNTVLNGACPGPLTFRRGLAAEMGARRLVVETSDPTHPLVYIEAYDL
jgi:hypothetical protein